MLKNKTGAVMSIERVLDNKKHGGAHELTHELVSNTDSCDYYVLVSDNSVHKQTNADPDCLKFQDGGLKESDSDENGFISDNLQFLSDDLDKYEQAVVENNAEWLKARCRAIDPVEFDMVTASSANLELLGMMDETGMSVSSVSENHMSISSANDVLASESQPLLAQSSDMNVLPSSSDISTISGQLPVSMETDMSVYTNGNMQLDGIMLVADKDKDMELESVDPASISHQLKANGIGDFQNTFTENLLLGDLNCGKSGIAQVIMKDGVLSLVSNESGFEQDTEDNLMMKSPNTYITTTQVSQDTPVIMTEPTLQSQDNMSMNTSDITLANSQLIIPSMSQTENLALATISISNDKLANSTKILVDTNQGRRLYELNMSDLTGLVNNQTIGLAPGQEQPDISASLMMSEKHEQITAQTVPGYLLLSVANKEDEPQSIITTNQINTQIPPPSRSKQKNEPMYMCTFDGCGQLFRALPKLTVHSATHTGERPFKCPEPGCDWAFTKAYKLKRHEECHNGNKKHVCPECNKKFTTVYNLNSHAKSHSRPCTEVCPVETCGLKFPTRRQLDRHLKTHEGLEKTYKCPFEGCNKLFYSAHCLGSHPRVHMADPLDLYCQFEGCGRKFDKVCRLKQHQRTHTGERPYACHFEGCKWSFATSSKLTRHMMKHTKKRKWVCNECGKAFMRAEHLKGHMIIHSGIKPFECPVPGCGLKFVSKSSVNVHMKKHDNVDKNITYHCPLEACDKKYTNKANLRQHIVKHFPGTLKPEDAAQLDIVQLFTKHEADNAKKTVLQPSAVTVKTDADGTMKIDPVEFIATTVNQDGVISQSVSNQFTAELTPELTSMYTATDTTSKSGSNHPSTSQPKISFKKDEKESSGSARTDYYSNKLLSDRAQKRRKLLREKAEGSESIEDPLEIKNSSVEEPKPVSVADALCSQGITFRDPATGVLYVQMQLLQDDPPHPDLYSDDTILPSDISLQETSDSDMPDDVQPAEFVGSTINLQDLVG